MAVAVADAEGQEAAQNVEIGPSAVANAVEIEAIVRIVMAVSLVPKDMDMDPMGVVQNDNILHFLTSSTLLTLLQTLLLLTHSYRF